jgi:hypothetical protein
MNEIETKLLAGPAILPDHISREEYDKVVGYLVDIGFLK